MPVVADWSGIMFCTVGALSVLRMPLMAMRSALLLLLFCQVPALFQWKRFLIDHPVREALSSPSLVVASTTTFCPPGLWNTTM